MTFRCPNEQYHFERIPLSQNIEYRVIIQLSTSSTTSEIGHCYEVVQLCLDWHDQL